MIGSGCAHAWRRFSWSRRGSGCLPWWSMTNGRCATRSLTRCVPKGTTCQRRRLPRQTFRARRARGPAPSPAPTTGVGSPVLSESKALLRRYHLGSADPRRRHRRRTGDDRPARVRAARNVPPTPRQVLTREVAFERVWGNDFRANSNSLEVCIGYVRRKTERADHPRLIHTARGVGYVLRDTPR